MKSIGFIAVFLVGILLLGGCAQTFRFKVDALAAPSAGGGQTYVIERAGENSEKSDLRFQDSVRYVRRALERRGYVLSEENPDLRIEVELSISNPLNDTETYSEPIYYRTWGQSRVVHTPVVNQDGKVVGRVATRVYYPPESYFMGYRHYDRSVIVYEKKLTLTARDKSGEEQWTVTVKTIDRSDDLRYYVPYLAAAVVPYLGQSTDGAVLVSLSEDDPAVTMLKAGSYPGN